jgi:hypothetical protein
MPDVFLHGLMSRDSNMPERFGTGSGFGLRKLLVFRRGQQLVPSYCRKGGKRHDEIILDGRE